MFKKFIIALSIMSIFGFKNMECSGNVYYVQTGVSAHPIVGIFSIGLVATSALMAYYGHKILLNNNFYREKFTPAAKNVSLFLQGSSIIKRILGISKNENAVFDLATTAAFGTVTYQFNSAMCKNEFYKQEVDPRIKKFCLFMEGTGITSAALLGTIVGTIAVLSQIN